ncbi:hypothetical protein E2C01_006297 [Portunus trituberculatus]|uniref:Uncharacterized protein n=1 Tax=Portunus trituberculatus TaxID=210409 RepID=A0A5B7CVY1_PORTR|nr:hypothetical protein [Portunus trituberculatus]
MVATSCRQCAPNTTTSCRRDKSLVCSQPYGPCWLGGGHNNWCQEFWDKVWLARLLGTREQWQTQTLEAVRCRKAVSQIGKGWKT